MEKYSALGEILYILSRCEKGRINTHTFWNKKYVNSLNDSLKMMITLIDLLEKTGNITEKELIPIINFVNQNAGTIFPHPIKTVPLLEQNNQLPLSLIDCTEIMSLMRNLIIEVQELLRDKNKKYKIKIFYLLSALHNLPKVFLRADKITFFNIGVEAITTEEAKECADSRLEIMKESSV